MHPLLASPRKLLAYLMAWLLAGLGLAALLHLTDQATWPGALAFALPLALLQAFVALSAYYLCRAQPHAQRRWGPIALRFGAAALVAGLAWLALGEAWNAAGRLGPREQPFVAMAPAGWVLFFTAGAMLYVVSLLAHDVLVAFETVQDAARREAESRVLARDAELQMLRTQIDPHFLFNSLNSISALTAFDAVAARDMTIDLAQFFRRTLAVAERERIPLSEELALCRHYLAIEQRRFGARLRSELRVSPDAAACAIPPMLLQPLLENALKHGVRHLDDGGTVTVDAEVRDGWLHLAVANPVADDAPAHTVARQATHGGPGLGLGLQNLRARLAVLHGSRARVDCVRAPGRFTVTVTLPAESSSPPDGATPAAPAVPAYPAPPASTAPAP